jgi:hypothetical protein
MNMDDFAHCSLAMDMSLCSMGQYHPGFPRVLWYALICLGYDRPTPLHHCRLF